MKTVVDRRHKLKNPPLKSTTLATLAPTAPNSRPRSHANSQTNGPVTKIVKTIDQFYNKLANIPLSTLLTSHKPHEWLKEQDETLLRLARRVGQKQEGAGEKLQAIQNILSNIRTNLGMWNKIDLMKNYQTSNANTDQELSSKETTKSIRANQNLLSYDQYEIRAKQSTKKQRGDIGNIQAQTVRSENTSDSQIEDKENLNRMNMKMTKEKGRNYYRQDNLSTKRNESIADSHYLQIIKELRVQLAQKDRELENILINQQSYQDTLQLQIKAHGQLKMENAFLKQRLDNATVMIKEKEAAAQAAREREAQLKQGLRMERQRFKRQVEFRDEAQDRYSSYMDENVRLSSRIQQLEAEIKEKKKQEKVSLQKITIYSAKYHKVWNQLQKSKEQVSGLKGELKKREFDLCELSTLKEDVGRTRRDILSRCQL